MHLKWQKTLTDISKPLKAAWGIIMRYTKAFFKIILAVIVFAVNLLGIAVCFVIPYVRATFETVDLEAFLYNIIMPTDGMESAYIREMILMIVSPTILCMVILGLLFLFCAAKTKKNKKKFRTVVAVETVGIFSVAAALLFSFFKGGDFIQNHMQSSSIIEDNYIDPREVKMAFPEKKRNLIYIYLESMETTYMDKENGGNFEKNCIPELTKLCREHTNFSTRDGIGGFHMVLGADYTSASIFAQTVGLPLKLPIMLSEGFKQENFMAGAYSIGEILQNQGYKNYFMIGSDRDYGGRASYLQQHGNYGIFDYNTAIERGYIDGEYHVWWGYEDEKLFEYAKSELTDISSQGQPFNFTMLTVDTHYLDGYECRLCKSEYGSQYENVFACSSRQVNNFVKWIQKQDFYENTTIIMCGDHLTMNNKFIPGDRENRRVYNVCINPAVHTDNSKNRQFCAFDMFPTTLAALGVEIEGERLGMGTNMFSDKQTLMEEIGCAKFKEEIKKDSVYYSTHFLK